MAISTKKSFILKGTRLGIDLLDQFRSFGFIEFRTTGGTGLDTDLNAAVQHVLATAPAVFPGTGIPFARVTHSEWLNDTDHKIILMYQRDSRDSSSVLGTNGVARFRTGITSFQWFQTSLDCSDPGTPKFDATTFRPNGDPSFFNNSLAQINQPPVPYQTRTPTVVIIVWGTLSTNPIATVAPKLETSNSDTPTYGNFVFPANTLRFDGAMIDWFLENGVDQFAYQYQFTHVKGEWQDQHACWNRAAAPLVWSFVLQDRYIRKPYAGAANFPGTT